MATRRCLLFGVCLWVVAPASAVAQIDAASRAAEIGRAWDEQLEATPPREASEGLAGEGSVAPPDGGPEGYGDQQILLKSNWEPWSIRADLGIFRSDNVALSDGGGRTDNFVAAALEIEYTPKIHGSLFFDWRIRQAFYRYDDFTELNFDAFSNELGLLYVAKDFSDIHIHLNYRYDRLTDNLIDDELYTNHAIVLGAYKVFPRYRGGQARRRYECYLGVHAAWSLDGDPAAARRDEYVFKAGLLYRFTNDLRAQIRWYSGYYDYDAGSRHDFTNSLSLIAEYDLWEWLTLSAGLTGTINDSNRSRLDYEAFTPGLNLGFHTSF